MVEKVADQVVMYCYWRTEEGLVNDMIRETRTMTFAMIEPIFELRVSEITAWNYGISFFYYPRP